MIVLVWTPDPDGTDEECRRIISLRKANAENRPVIRSNLAKLDATADGDIARQIAKDPDTAPELTDEWFDKAEIRDGDRLIRPARPPLDFSKKLMSLRKSSYRCGSIRM